MNKYKYDEIQTQVMLEMILDKTISNDCKIFYLIELLHAENISLEKAKELLFKSGIVNKSTFVIDAENMDEFTHRYNQLMFKKTILKKIEEQNRTFINGEKI